jgi:hypothetical protein
VLVGPGEATSSTNVLPEPVCIVEIDRVTGHAHEALLASAETVDTARLGNQMFPRYLYA